MDMFVLIYLVILFIGCKNSNGIVFHFKSLIGLVMLDIFETTLLASIREMIREMTVYPLHLHVSQL